MTLYTKAGAEPTSLPFLDYDPDGNAWTNLQDNPDGRSACGWAEAPQLPLYDPETSVVTWAGSGWLVSLKTPEQLAVDLEVARSDLLAQAEAVYSAKVDGGTTTPSGPFATDADAQRLVGGAATAVLAAAQFGFPFSPIAFSMADKTSKVLDGPAIVGVGMAVVSHVAACRSAFTAIESAIEAAQDRDSLSAVDLQAGYPA